MHYNVSLFCYQFICFGIDMLLFWVYLFNVRQQCHFVSGCKAMSKFCNVNYRLPPLKQQGDLRPLLKLIILARALLFQEPLMH